MSRAQRLPQRTANTEQRRPGLEDRDDDNGLATWAQLLARFGVAAARWHHKRSQLNLNLKYIMATSTSTKHTMSDYRRRGRAGSIWNVDAAAFRISQSHLLASLLQAVVCVSLTCAYIHSSRMHTHTHIHIHTSVEDSTQYLYTWSLGWLVFVSSFDLNVLKFKDQIAFGLFSSLFFLFAFLHKRGTGILNCNPKIQKKALKTAMHQKSQKLKQKKRYIYLYEQMIHICLS